MEIGILNCILELKAALTKPTVHYLEALTKESELRSSLMLAELHEQEERAKQEQALKEQVQKERERYKAREKMGKGMMRAPFGYCPQCNKPGIWRNKTAGTDTCRDGHIYLSLDAVLRFDKKDNKNDD